MLKLHPNFLKKNGRKEFVILPFDEYERIEELIQDAYDIRAMRQARRKDADKPSLSLAEAKERLGL